MSVDTASSQPGDVVLPIQAAGQSTAVSAAPGSVLEPDLIQELWLAAKGAEYGLTCEEFGSVLTTVGEKVNYGLAAGNSPDAAQRATFLRSLHLSELALAHSCVLGRDAGWQRFLNSYRSS